VRTLPLSRLPAQFDETRTIDAIGLVPRFRLLPPVVGKIAQASAAWGVLAERDRITAIDGLPVGAFEDIGPLLQRVGGRPVMIEVRRDGDRLALDVTPRLTKDAQGTRWVLGVEPAIPDAQPAYDATLRYGPVAALPAAVQETGKLAGDSLAMIGRLLTGHASVANVSGPITIARYANASAQLGPAWFLNFLALLSLTLAIVNLLPIPVLDGGHLLYYLIELVKGSPVSERAQIAGQYVGLVLLVALMGLAFYNDILRIAS
jgi:regulator of sigma E protease